MGGARRGLRTPGVQPVFLGGCTLGKGKVIGAASFPALECAFAEELDEALRPDNTVWVLVPTNLLALHLRRECARRRGGIMGVEFLTLRDAASRMVGQRLAARGMRPMPAGAPELALQALLDCVPDRSWLAAFRSFSNGPSAILRAIGLLANCLWTPEALRHAADNASFADRTAPGRLRDLADVWAEYQAWKDERRLFDTDDLVIAGGRDEASADALPDAWFLYGFYDLAPAQRALVGRVIAEAGPCAAYLLWAERDGAPAPGFEYAAPTVQWLLRQLGAERVQCLTQEPQTDLGRLVARMFDPQPLMPEDDARQVLDEREDDADGTVRVLSCPGDMPEAVEVAREVLRVADEGGDGLPASVGVLLRSAAESAGHVAEALGRAGVRYSLREGLPLAQTVAGRIALQLLELARGDAERVAVVDFLALAEMDWPEGLSATTVDRLSRLAGVTRGHQSWTNRLTRHAEQLTRRSRSAEDDDAAAACSRDAELCRTAVGFLQDFFSGMNLSAFTSWAQATGALGRLVRQYAPADDPGTAPVLQVIEGAAALDVAGPAPDASRLASTIGRLLANASLSRERFQHVGVSVSGIMAVRGATFDVVIVPGLVEKGFPRHIPAGSLLTELDRDALNALAAEESWGTLPRQSERPLEERYLFRLALGSARRAVVLAYPRIEEHTGRPRIASRFLVDACSALCGCSVTPAMLDDGLPRGLVQRVPLSRRGWPEGELRLALDTLEYDDAVFSGPAGDARHADYVAAISPFFGRALEMEKQRWGRAAFGPYDGKVRDQALLESLRERYARFGSPVSPTRMETYAKCPFAYFLTYVLKVAEVEAPPEEFELTPLEHGSLVHELLARLYGKRLKGRTLGAVTDDELADMLADAGSILDDLGGAHAANHPATWQIERESVLDQIRRLLEVERREHPLSTPSLLEYAFGTDENASYEFELGPGRVVAFHGRIDRVDKGLRDAIRVIDYKTGKSNHYKPDRLLGGTQLQLPIYLLAASKLLEADDGEAAYSFVREQKEVSEFTLVELRERIDDFRRALRIIVDGIAAGDFYPAPAPANNACGSYCSYACVCGAARRFLAEMKQGDPALARLNELWEIA